MVKWLWDPGECFVGCADLIETYHYPLAFSRPLPQVPCSPFLFPVYRFTVRTSPRYDILPLRLQSPPPIPSHLPLFVHTTAFSRPLLFLYLY